jgi:hypothetical protein
VRKRNVNKFKEYRGLTGNWRVHDVESDADGSNVTFASESDEEEQNKPKYGTQGHRDAEHCGYCVCMCGG